MGIAGDAEVMLEEGMARRLWDYSPLGIFLADAEGRCIYINAACQQITGMTQAQALGRLWRESVHPDDRQRIAAEWQKAAREQQALQAEVRVRRPDASVVWVRLHEAVVECKNVPSTHLLMVEDISERKAAEEALFQEKERARVTLDSIGDAVLVTDLAGNITYLNLQAENLTGWSSEEALGRPLTDVFCIVDGATGETAPNPAHQAIEENRTVGLKLGCVLVRRDRSEVPIEDSAAPIHNRDGAVSGAVIVFHDVAHSRAMVEQNARLARYDHLTGLANTWLLAERMTQAISLAHRHGTRLALLFIDLNRFKGVNDAHGHLAGDELLKSVSTRLKGCVRMSDTVCRRGGDEFVILLSELEYQQDAAHVAEKLLAALSAPYFIDGSAVAISASVGISVYPDDGDDVTTLLRGADLAMYQAKASSPSGYHFAGTGRPRPADGNGLPPRAHRAEHRTAAVPHFLRLESPT